MIELFGEIEVKRIEGHVNIVPGQMGGGDLQEKTVTPSNSQQVVTPDSGFSGLSSVTVEAVKLQNKTVKPGSAVQAVQADDGSTGLGTVTVEPAPLQEKTIAADDEEQTVLPDSGYYGLKSVLVRAIPAALPNAEGATFCTDNNIPEIPADVLATYPKAVVFKVTSASSTQFVYIAAKSAFYLVKGDLLGMAYEQVVGSLGEAVKASATSGTWGDYIPAAAGTAGLMVGTEGGNTYSLVWANHDVYEVLAVDTTTGKITTGAVYFARSSADLGGKYYYNGVLLPEIPADALATYPYAWIRKHTTNDQYQLILAASPFYYNNSGVYCSAGENAPEPWYNITISTADTATEWTFNTSASGFFSVDDARPIFWSNHNIMSGSITATNIYFKGTEPIPESEYSELYQIQRETIDGIGDEVNRLCNTEEPMTPARMAEKMQNLDITLQDIVITPSDEEQIIKPEGHYGFYKITVGAVENSGTGGGGTPGEGEGGDTGDDTTPEYPSLEEGGLVYEETSMEVPTGKYKYGNVSEALPAFPVKYQYQLIQKSSSDWKVRQTDSPLWHNNSSLYPVSSICNYVTYICEYPDYNEWTPVNYESGSTNSNTAPLFGSGVYWSNYDVTFKSGGILNAASTPVPEMEVRTTYAPTGTDAIYNINGDTVVSLGTAVYEITGVQAATPQDMIDALYFYAASTSAAEESTE